MERFHVAVWSVILPAVTLFMSACTSQRIATCPPPPPGGQVASPPVFHYDHAIPASPVLFADLKPVVALLRTQDITDFAEVLPFGRRKVVVLGENGPRVELQGALDAPPLLPPDVRQLLLHALQNCNELAVADRERIIELLREITFANSNYSATQPAVRPGKIVGVHYILEGAFFPAGSPIAMHAAQAGILAPGRTAGPADVNVIYINAYEVETGLVKAVACGADPNITGACKNAVKDLVRQFADAKPAVRVVNLQGNNVLIDCGSTNGVKVGQTFTAQGGQVVLEAWKVDPLSCLAKLIRGKATDVTPGLVVSIPKTPPSPVQ